jgi:predicted regulator of Ras-like GTPase activity (Roadblock/LC7/MglB family)
MFTLLKKMFGRKPATPAEPVRSAPTVIQPRAVATASPSPAPAVPGENPVVPRSPQVAVAQLSLAAIIGKLPADLRKNVAKVPADSVTVALPMATIHKQLPGGAVKMSLASLYRQAPPGTFTQVKVEEKRMVEVPLSEIFRHVDAQALRRRGDQRKVDLRGAPQLFGDKSNPYAIAPSGTEDEVAAEEPLAEEQAAYEEEEPAAPPVAPRFQLSEDGPSRMPEAPALVRAMPSPAISTAPANGALSVPLQSVWDQWPGEIRAELEHTAEASIVLPADRVGAGLSKGKVAFAWGELRSWIQPLPGAESAVAAETEVVLPLKVVAPIFLAHSRPATRRKTAELDESIPALFGGGPPPAPAPAPVATPAEAPMPEAAREPAAPAAAAPLTFRLAPPAELAPEAAPAPAAEPAATPDLEAAFLHEPEPAPEPEAAPLPMESHEHPAVVPLPSGQTLGDLFGEPGKTHWSAQELIARSARLPGVAGAILALQEGLLVAADLPEEMKGDTVAAFLPQIFARLNHYMGEMKLAGVEDILLTTNGAHLQAYRLGEVYFAVLGQPGASLPWDALRLVVQELAAQAPK